MGQPEVVGQAAVERIMRPSSRGVGDGHVPTLLSGTQHAAERRKPGQGELPVRDCSIQGALRCRIIMPATPWAVLRDGPEVIEGGDDSVPADVAEAEGPYARGVDYPGVGRVRQP